MEKSLIVLEDGTEISSGAQGENVICQIKLTEQVNEGKILNPGAVCPTVLEAELLAPAGELHIPVGSDLTLHRIKSDGAWEQLGLFTVGDVIRPGPNRYLITAYDRLHWLNKDLTAWVDSLDEWPYRMQTFAHLVCEACDVHLEPGYFTNGEWPVHKFTPVSVTGRELMQWVGELSCRFCRATPEGSIRLDWYTEAEQPLLAEKNTFMFRDSLSRGDYLTDAVDKVIIRADKKERGYIYGTGSNAYVITGNLLMAVVPNETFEGLARVLYEKLSPIQYTPCKVTVPVDFPVKCGDILYVRDWNFQQFPMYVMKKTQSGKKSILECTGSARRSKLL